MFIQIYNFMSLHSIPPRQISRFFSLVDFSGRYWRFFGLRVPVAGSSPPLLRASRTSPRGRGRSGPRLRRSAAPEASTAPAALPLGPGGTVRERSPCGHPETGTRAALARAFINILFGVREPEQGESGKFGGTSGAGAGHARAVRVELQRSAGIYHTSRAGGRLRVSGEIN